MPSELKELMVSELTEKIGGLDSCAFVDFTGLNAQAVRDLRLKLHQADSRLFVVKNRLAQRVLPDDMATALPDLFAGSTAVAHGTGDPSAMLKTLIDWGKKNRPLPLKGGLERFTHVQPTLGKLPGGGLHILAPQDQDPAVAVEDHGPHIGPEKRIRRRRPVSVWFLG